MDGYAPHAHIVLKTASDEIVVIRRIRDGRVYYVLPGTEVAAGETPGAAAARAALDDLGVDVGVEETLYVMAFSGVDHFFFLAACDTDVQPADHAVEHATTSSWRANMRARTRSRSCHVVSCSRTTSAHGRSAGESCAAADHPIETRPSPLRDPARLGRAAR